MFDNQSVLFPRNKIALGGDVDACFDFQILWVVFSNNIAALLIGTMVRNAIAFSCSFTLIQRVGKKMQPKEQLTNI